MAKSKQDPPSEGADFVYEQPIVTKTSSEAAPIGDAPLTVSTMDFTAVGVCFGCSSLLHTMGWSSLMTSGLMFGAGTVLTSSVMSLSSAPPTTLREQAEMRYTQMLGTALWGVSCFGEFCSAKPHRRGLLFSSWLSLPFFLRYYNDYAARSELVKW
uniref:Uncharacterized protein n=1 Tax=Neobodo designis TaxID=312471 RepID=A0A6U4U8J9_NEODS|mmetsp:Transcript_40189/g.124188  ORF Transcript_40189/g.124188 Transcript_40189/m.124188 type:complete len:156 (+) Transcript_40189:26-493(+)